ncbi:MAG: PQQ-binding-like beta-propeller repeat protein [Actinomycetota bacterium]
MRVPPHRSPRANLVSLLLALIVLVSTGAAAIAGTATGTPGTERWVERYGGPGNRFDGAREVAVSPDGGTVFVTGDSNGPSSRSDFATLAYDAADGTTLWTKRYDGPAGTDDFASSLAVSPDGTTVFVAGESNGATGGLDYAVLAHDATTGDRLWKRRYDGPGHSLEALTGLAVTPDGSAVLVTGRSIGASSGSDVATLAFDAASGTRLWVARYNRAGQSSDGGNAVTVTPDGSMALVAGFITRSGSNSDYLTQAYDATTGARVWTKKFGGPAGEDDVAGSITVSPDGTRTFVTGNGTGATNSTNYTTIAYDTATGDRQWTRRYDGPGHATDFANAIAADPAGANVYVTGQSDGDTTGADFATVAYDAMTGADGWTQRHGGPDDSFDGAVAIATSPDGVDVFVTGIVGSPSSLDDYSTLAYEAGTGSPLWDETYNGPGNGPDRTFDLAVNPSGDAVFVTGFSRGELGFEYATVSYAA